MSTLALMLAATAVVADLDVAQPPGALGDGHGKLTDGRRASVGARLRGQLELRVQANETIGTSARQLERSGDALLS